MARPTTRPPIQRILILDREIRSGRFPNSRRFIELLEVDRRTILRDLEFMRDRLHAPIEFDRRRQGYRCTREGAGDHR
ncbi:MAG: HTH domain-containing protein [Isosphaeraceae bacterium]|nr:HTH domain-containing protein [Isosphaeraceae bacterium]